MISSTEESSRYPQTNIRYSQEITQQHHNYVTAEKIQTIANTIFEKKDRGITYKDLLKPPYKLVDTKKQAQKVLNYHKTRGNLYTNSTMTIPQQYFVSKEDAEEAAINTKKIRYPHPTEVHGLRRRLNTQQVEGVQKRFGVVQTNIQMAIDDRKADNVYEVLDRLVDDTNGELPVGLHNIRIHLSLTPDYASEAYYERLAHLPESGTQERSKKAIAVIDGFEVELFFYPKGKVVIMVRCSDSPFPISLDSPDLVTSDFTSFVAQIRRVICTHLSDNRGRIVPPIHHPSWCLIHADLNWDVPSTMLNYLGMDGLQITKPGDILLRLYRKRIRGERFIRGEVGVYPFRNAPINESIGQTIVAAAREAKKELSMRGGV